MLYIKAETNFKRRQKTMSMYREAAEVVLRRQVGVYGFAKATQVANLSGYAIDNSGYIVSVTDEDRAFRRLVENTEKYLGPLAAINCRTALMVCTSRDTDMALRQISKGSEDMALSVNNLNNAVAFFNLSEKRVEAPMNDRIPLFVKAEDSKPRRTKESTVYPASGFLQRVFSFLL